MLDVLDSEFLTFQLQSTRIQNLIGLAQGSSREGLTIHEIRNYYLKVPSLDIQEKIVAHIKSETRLLDITISKKHAAVFFSRRYRNFHAYTGRKCTGLHGYNPPFSFINHEQEAVSLGRWQGCSREFGLHAVRLRNGTGMLASACPARDANAASGLMG